MDILKIWKDLSLANSWQLAKGSWQIAVGKGQDAVGKGQWWAIGSWQLRVVI